MAFTTDVSILVVTCAPGCAPVLAQEIEALGLPVTWTGETAVESEGTLDDCMRLNLYIRTGHRVLYMVGGFSARDPDELYAKSCRVSWEDYISPDGYFTVEVSVDTPTIRNDMFAALKIKDAVADRFRHVCGRRPDSGSEDRGVSIFLHWAGRDAALYLDTTGASLSKRGYRVCPSSAPMRESLAAAIVLSTGWKGEGHFVNPMCGGGTLAIEAVMIATNRPPALLRSEFSFMSLLGFEPSAWRALRTQAIANIRHEIPGRILCSDVSEEAILSTRENAMAASVEDLLEFETCDFTKCTLPEEPLEGSVIVANPPYGDRMGDALKLRSTYEALGEFIRANSALYRGYVFTASSELADQIGLVRTRELPFFAGAKEARLIEFSGEVEAKRGSKYDAFRDHADDEGLAGV